MIAFTQKESKELQAIQAKIGEGVNPSWAICLDKINLLKQAQFPRSFFWVNRVKDNKVLHHFGLDKELDYLKNISLTPELLLGTMHPNQRPILVKQIIAIFKLVLKYSNDFNNGTYLYSCKRAFRDGKGQFWLVDQTSEVLQTDENGHIATNFNWFHILGKYKGEPLATEIFFNKQSTKKVITPLRIIQREFDNHKASLLQDLGFTKMQRLVVEDMAQLIRLKRPEKNINTTIAKHLGITVRTIQGHRTKLLQLGRTIFPLNNFKDAIDVVRHLMAHDLVRKTTT